MVETIVYVESTLIDCLLYQGVEISPTNIRTTNGVSAGLEAIAFILADPEDVILVPTPTYSR